MKKSTYTELQIVFFETETTYYKAIVLEILVMRLIDIERQLKTPFEISCLGHQPNEHIETMCTRCGSRYYSPVDAELLL